jgi:uncharacterized membrane protein
MAARHVMILIDRRQMMGAGWLPAVAPLVVAILGLGILSAFQDPTLDRTVSERQVAFTVVRGIVDLRCASCHSRAPADKAFLAAPIGMSFDTDREIAARAPAIASSISVTRSMPPRNSTGMTEEERALIVRWVEEGARIE